MQEIVEQTVTGLGYDLVEIERSAGGLLRITIDLPWVKPAEGSVAPEQFITVEDCEKVTRQLHWKSMARNTSGWRSPRPVLTVPCAMYRILSVSSAKWWI